MRVEAKHLEIPRDYYLNPPAEKVVIHKGGSNIPLLADQPTFFSTVKIELQRPLGCLGYVDGGTYPRKGVPNETSVFRVNIVKEIIKQSIKNPILILTPNRTLKSFNEVCARLLGSERVHPLSFCPCAAYISYMIEAFLIGLGIKEDIAEETAYHMAHIFELDDAYRYRVQDIAGEVDTFLLRTNPRRELIRLMNIWTERDLKIGVIWKMEYYMKPLLFLLHIPRIRRAFLKILPYIKGMEFDAADLYWASIKGDIILAVFLLKSGLRLYRYQDYGLWVNMWISPF